MQVRGPPGSSHYLTPTEGTRSFSMW